MMAAINVERMTLKQIEALEVQIAKAKTEARETAKADLKAKIDRLIDGSDFNIAELYGFKSKKGRGKSAAKYANPDDPSQTYSGRGRRPFWLLAKLKKGASLEDFAI
jgi:DNA-binding protein H-NS